MTLILCTLDLRVWSPEQRTKFNNAKPFTKGRTFAFALCRFASTPCEMCCLDNFVTVALHESPSKCERTHAHTRTHFPNKSTHGSSVSEHKPQFVRDTRTVVPKQIAQKFSDQDCDPSVLIFGLSSPLHVRRLTWVTFIATQLHDSLKLRSNSPLSPKSQNHKDSGHRQTSRPDSTKRRADLCRRPRHLASFCKRGQGIGARCPGAAACVKSVPLMQQGKHRL